MSNYIINNESVRIVSESAIHLAAKLPIATYTVEAMPVTNELYLLKTDSFNRPKKIYGEVDHQSDRIIKTFEARDRNTGVLLNGEKGSGKTFLAKYISWKLHEMGYPTILINAQYDTVALSQMIKNINEPCLIIFDEFEKIYSAGSEEELNSPQNGLLTLLDGLLVTKKLFIFTCNNDMQISDMLKNRPGRVFYSLEFGGIADDVLQSYCKENLANQEYLKEVLNIKKLFTHFTFDMMQALVEETNRYNDKPLNVVKMMNILPDTPESNFSVRVTNLAGTYEYCNNYNNDDDSCWCCPYNERAANIYVWKKPNKKQNADSMPHTRITIGLKHLTEQNEDEYVYVHGEYKITLTQKPPLYSRNLWKFADPYGSF